MIRAVTPTQGKTKTEERKEYTGTEGTREPVLGYRLRTVSVHEGFI